MRKIPAITLLLFGIALFSYAYGQAQNTRVLTMKIPLSIHSIHENVSKISLAIGFMDDANNYVFATPSEYVINLDRETRSFEQEVSIDFTANPGYDIMNATKYAMMLRLYYKSSKDGTFKEGIPPATTHEDIEARARADVEFIGRVEGEIEW